MSHPFTSQQAGFELVVTQKGHERATEPAKPAGRMGLAGYSFTGSIFDPLKMVF